MPLWAFILVLVILLFCAGGVWLSKLLFILLVLFLVWAIFFWHPWRVRGGPPPP